MFVILDSLNVRSLERLERVDRTKKEGAGGGGGGEGKGLLKSSTRPTGARENCIVGAESLPSLFKI